MRSERVAFEGALGVSLEGRLDRPDGEPKGGVVLTHCFTCSKDYLATRRIAHGLAARGYAALRFDLTGLGESGGRFESTTFSTNVGDIRAASVFLRSRHAVPLMLFGHSFGGAASLAAAEGLTGVRAVATLAAPSEPAQLLEHFAGVLGTIEAEGSVEVEIGGRPFRLTREFVQDVRATRLLGVIPVLKCAVLVLHSPQDRVVTPDHGLRIFEAARQPKGFLSLDGTDHLLGDRRDAERVATLLDLWFERGLESSD